MTKVPLAGSHVWTMWATHGQRISFHVWLTWSLRGHQAKAFWPFRLSRAPYAFFDRFRPSELRFQIRLWITNHDSHMHDED